jgi:hypothetical protein
MGRCPRYQVTVTVGDETYAAPGAVALNGPRRRARGAQAVVWTLWQDLPARGSCGPVTVRVRDSAGDLVHTVTAPDPDRSK